MWQITVQTPGPEKSGRKLPLCCFCLFLIKIIWRLESETDLQIHKGAQESHQTVMQRQIFLLTQIKGNLLGKKKAAMIYMKDITVLSVFGDIAHIHTQTVGISSPTEGTDWQSCFAASDGPASQSQMVKGLCSEQFSGTSGEALPWLTSQVAWSFLSTLYLPSNEI